MQKNYPVPDNNLENESPIVVSVLWLHMDEEY